MKYALFLKMLSVLLVSGLAWKANAQPGPAKYEAGINGGAFIYQGDLTPSRMGSYKTPGWALGFTGSRHLSDRFSLRADLSLGKLKGSDSVYSTPQWRQQRNFSFHSPVVELTAMLQWFPLSRERYKLTPYLFAGLGYSFLRIKRDYSRFNAEYFSNEPDLRDRLAIDTAHALPKGAPILPAGAGLRFTLSPYIALTAESAMRITPTDYLDGFSRAANPEHSDNYFKHSIGIIFSLGRKNYLDCPPSPGNR